MKFNATTSTVFTVIDMAALRGIDDFVIVDIDGRNVLKPPDK